MTNVYQNLLVSFSGTQVDSETRDLILKKKILGFTLFKWNIESFEQVQELTGELKSLANQAGYDLLLALDQEGGRVERLKSPFVEVPAMGDWGQLIQKTGSFDVLKTLGEIEARQIKTAGFDWNYAPVVDLNLYPDSPVIGDRAFSDDPDFVIKCAKVLMNAFHENDLMSCLKHFPGHGATLLDSHVDLPKDDREFDELWQLDLKPYQNLLSQQEVPAVMMAHVIFSRIDSEFVATLSEKFLKEILREQFKFNGIVCTDDFLMQALFDHYDSGEAACRFWQIGGDVVLIGYKPEKTLATLERIEKAYRENHDNLDSILQSSQDRIQKTIKPFLKNTEPLLLSDLENYQKEIDHLFNVVAT